MFTSEITSHASPASQPASLAATRAWGAAIGAWILGVLAAWTWFATERGTPGVAALSPIEWPSGSAIERDATRPTLLLFAHPRCPCTRATLQEFEKIAAHDSDAATLYVVLFTPADADEAWTTTDQWKTAATTPGVRIHRDVNGAEAKLFGAITSGQAVLFDASGRLQFSGGLTPGRGHVGDNDGRAAVEDWLAGKTPATTRTPVYGCSILVPSTKPPGRSL